MTENTDLLETCEDLVATLDTLMAHYGPTMPEGDRIQRQRVLDAAKAAVENAWCGEVEEQCTGHLDANLHCDNCGRDYRPHRGDDDIFPGAACTATFDKSISPRCRAGS